MASQQEKTQRERLIALLIVQELYDRAYEELQDEQEAIDEVDCTVAAGDALREYLERYEDRVCEVWEDRDRTLKWILAGDDG